MQPVGFDGVYDADAYIGGAARKSGIEAVSYTHLEFPLSPRFAHAAAYYLASMLIADENPELADTLFDRFSDAMATIRASVPATKGKIRNVYQ